MPWFLFFIVLTTGTNYPELQTVNDEVNLFSYIPDDPRDNRWANHEEFLSGKYGRDCEDFALEKARRLIARGYTLDQLELWTIDNDPDDDVSHLVLVVDKKYVLDNAALRTIYTVDEIMAGFVTGKYFLVDEPWLLDGVRFMIPEAGLKLILDLEIELPVPVLPSPKAP